MAADKVSFEPHAGATVLTTLPNGKTLRLGEGDSYSTSDPVEIQALKQAHGIKAADKRGGKKE